MACVPLTLSPNPTICPKSLMAVACSTVQPAPLESSREVRSKILPASQSEACPPISPTTCPTLLMP